MILGGWLHLLGAALAVTPVWGARGIRGPMWSAAIAAAYYFFRFGLTHPLPVR